LEDIIISNFYKEDWEEIKAIYKEGLETGYSTLETTIPTWRKWNEELIKECRLAARRSNEILGWAALTKFSTRKVYSGVADVRIYIKRSARGAGLGTKLLGALIKESEKQGYWTLQSKIFVKNKASIKLHKKCGFKKVGIREAYGRRNGKWQNILLMEKRSEVVGI